MPLENGDDAERYSEPEYDETPDSLERREVSDDVEDAANRAVEALERQEAVERMAEEAARKLDELESRSKEVEEIADRAVKRLEELERTDDAEDGESFEDGLGNDLGEVRDELHDEYVNDMNGQLEGAAQKDDGAEEGRSECVSSEVPEASESYEDASTGMVYAMETKSESEGEAQSELKDENEAQEQPESNETVDDVEESAEDKFTNKVPKQESECESVETLHSDSAEETEAQHVQQPEDNETLDAPENKASAVENEQSNQSEAKEEELKESTIESHEDPVEESEVKAMVDDVQEVDELSEDSNETPEQELNEDASETPEVDSSESIEQEEAARSEGEITESELASDIPEDFIDRVQGLVEQLEPPEDETGERVIVEALTGERIVDRSLEPQSFFRDDEEVSEKEKVRKRLRELFAELSEEEREQFKEIVRSRLESEKDLEELIRRHPSVRLSSDYTQKLKDARSFVQRKKRGQVPKLVQELWMFEVEREWAKVVGESIRISFEKSFRKTSDDYSKRTKSKIKLADSQGRLIETSKYPEIGGERFDSFRKLNSIIERRFPGLKENKSYPKWMIQAKEYFERSNLQKQHTHPTIFRMINFVLQNQNRVKSMRKRLGEFQDAVAVKQRLVELDMDKSIDSWPTADRQWRNLELYYKVLELLENGMLQCDVDRKLELGSTRTKAIIDGVAPWPIRIVVNPDSIRSKLQTEPSPIRLHKSLKEIGVKSHQQLNAKIKEYSGLATLSNFTSLKSDAVSYFKLIETLKGRQNIRNSELLEMGDKIGIAPTKARRWTLEASRPKLLAHIERAIKNKNRANDLRARLFVNSMNHLVRSKGNLYIEPHMNQWKNIDKLNKYTLAYFRFLNLLETGYPLNAIANILEVHETVILSWTKGILPQGLRILREIPTNSPRNGWKWLPLRVEESVYSDFIEVPIKNADFSSLLEVCNQLKLPFQKFMYILGMILADGYIQPTSKTSYSLRILLSQKYEWSKRILEDVSNAFSMLSPSRISYSERQHDSICELYIDSPFFVWMREAIFNLGPNDKKTYSTLNADWIHRIPRDSQISFLQGIADGDGYASSIGQRVGIASLANKRLIKKILKTFNIESLLRKKGLEIIHHESILNLRNLPLFKNATGRLENLSEICEMINARPKRKRVSSFEISEISRLKQKGLTYGEISLCLWRKHEISRSIATIGRIARQYKTNP